MSFVIGIALLCCAIPALKAHEQSWYEAVPKASASPTPASLPSPSATPNERLVLIDPSHGGDDRGAILANHLVEKDVTLAFARDLRKELFDRGIACRLLRDGDVSMSLEHRAEAANDPHVGLYVALHAGRLARTIRVYSPVLPANTPAGTFVPWQDAQHTALKRSRSIAQEFASELGKHNLPVSISSAPLRPLNNVVPPAIAVEIPPEQVESRTQTKPGPERNIASALALAIANARNQWSVRQ